MQYANENNTLVVTKMMYNQDGSTFEQSNKFNRNFLEKQLVDITAQRNQMIAAKEAELAEVSLLLTKCDELDVTLQEDINQ